MGFADETARRDFQRFAAAVIAGVGLLGLVFVADFWWGERTLQQCLQLVGRSRSAVERELGAPERELSAKEFVCPLPGHCVGPPQRGFVVTYFRNPDWRVYLYFDEHERLVGANRFGT